MMQIIQLVAVKNIAEKISPAWLPQLESLKNSFLKDARHLQISFLSSFLLSGIFFLHWDADTTRFGITISACLLTQFIFTSFTTKDFSSLKSALITSLSLCLLLKTGNYYTVICAATLAVASKFIVRINNKHIFNPANFGIIAVMLLTNDAWISPGQWGSQIVLLFGIGAAGMFILARVKRIDVCLAFLLTFSGLHFYRMVIYQGWELDVFFHHLTNGSLMLFSFFMITDPMTTPNAPKARICFGFFVGLLAFFLSTRLYVHSAPVWALFILSPLSILFDKFFIHQKFKWITT